jgi:hypothetical protein
MKMINSFKFQNLSVNEQYFNLAHGYLEGSRSLCNAIIKGDYMPEHSHACVIVSASQNPRKDAGCTKNRLI